MHPIVGLLFVSVLSCGYGEIGVRSGVCDSGKCLLVKLPKPGPGCKDTAKVTYIWEQNWGDNFIKEIPCVVEIELDENAPANKEYEIKNFDERAKKGDSCSLSAIVFSADDGDRFQLVNIKGNVSGCTDGSNNRVYSSSFLIGHPGPDKTEPTHKTLLEGFSVGASKPGSVELKHQRHDLSTKSYDDTFVWKHTFFTTTIRKGSKTIVEVPQLCETDDFEDKVEFNQLINHTDIKAGDKLTACVSFQLLEQVDSRDLVGTYGFYRFKPVVRFPNMTNEECADFTVGSDASLAMPAQLDSGNCLTKGAKISFSIHGSDKVYNRRD